MNGLKNVLTVSKNVVTDGDALSAALILGVAYFAGKDRSVEIFKVSNANGLLLAGTAASGGLVYGHIYVSQGGRGGENLESTIQKCCFIVVMCLMVPPPLSKAFPKTYQIPTKEALQFGVLATMIKCGQASVVMLHKDWNRAPQYQVTDKINQIDFDTIVGGLSEQEMIKSECIFQLQYIKGRETCDAAIFNEVWNGTVERDPEHGFFGLKHLKGDALTDDEKDYVWYLNKVLGYLYDKKVALESSNEEMVAYRELVSKVFAGIHDSLRNCVNQRVSGICYSIIEVLDDMDIGSSTAEVQIALELQKYRTELIKTVVAKTQDSEGADLEIDLGIEIQKELNLPKSRITTNHLSSEKKRVLYNKGNYDRAREEFFQEYDPARHLIENINYHTLTGPFNEMAKWFCEEMKEDELLSKFGTDFLDYGTYDAMKPEAVSYYLLHCGFIKDAPQKNIFERGKQWLFGIKT